MSDVEPTRTRDGERAEASSAPLALLGAAWLIPGLGHLILGKRARAAIFAGVVVACFVTGIALHGELTTPQPDAPFSYLGFLASLGNGLLYIVGRLVGIGAGNPMAAGFSYGNTFLITGGLMNLLTVLDVSDIARGVKD